VAIAVLAASAAKTLTRLSSGDRAEAMAAGIHSAPPHR
jgi:hypothetical protein